MADSNKTITTRMTYTLKQLYNDPTLALGKIMQTNITISHELLHAAKIRAAEQERSLAAYIRHLIREDLEKAGEQQKKLNLKRK